MKYIIMRCNILNEIYKLCESDLTLHCKNEIIILVSVLF